MDNSNSIIEWLQHPCTRILSKAIDKMLTTVLQDNGQVVISPHKGGSEYVLGQANILNVLRHLGTFVKAQQEMKDE